MSAHFEDTGPPSMEVEAAHCAAERESLGRLALDLRMLVASMRSREQATVFTEPPEGHGVKSEYRRLHRKVNARLDGAGGAVEIRSCWAPTSASGRAISHRSAWCGMMRLRSHHG